MIHVAGLGVLGNVGPHAMRMGRNQIENEAITCFPESFPV